MVESGRGGRDLLRAAMALYAEVVTSDFGMCASRVGEDPLSEDKRRALRQRKGEVDVDFRLLVEQGMERGWIVAGDAAVAAFTVSSTSLNSSRAVLPISSMARLGSLMPGSCTTMWLIPSRWMIG